MICYKVELYESSQIYLNKGLKSHIIRFNLLTFLTLRQTKNLIK